MAKPKTTKMGTCSHEDDASHDGRNDDDGTGSSGVLVTGSVVSCQFVALITGVAGQFVGRSSSDVAGRTVRDVLATCFAAEVVVGQDVRFGAVEAGQAIGRLDPIRALEAEGDDFYAEEAFEEVVAGHLRRLALDTGHLFRQIHQAAGAVSYYG